MLQNIALSILHCTSRSCRRSANDDGLYMQTLYFGLRLPSAPDWTVCLYVEENLVWRLLMGLSFLSPCCNLLFCAASIYGLDSLGAP